ncbi:MAG: hypothetical protein JWO31_1721, partial [Phycisphaerales bacterium]|nr:hypothetical protein [Phycisphaerales bacterium]
RYAFDVTGTLTAATRAEFHDALNRYRNVMGRPRGGFTVSWSEDDGSDPRSYYTFEGGQDIEFGPKPGPFEFTQFVGGLAAVYTWSLVVAVKECFASCTATPESTANVLSLTRAYEHDVDADGFTERRCTGRLTVRGGDDVFNGKPADTYRWLCVPELPKGFAPGPMSFTQSVDGRTLDFSVVQKELMWTLPAPVTSGEATFGFTIRGYGGMADCVLNGRFSAPANVTKQVILQRIGALLVSKLPSDSVTVIWDSLSIQDSVYGNSLQFSFAWRRAAFAGDPEKPESIWDKVGGTPPGYADGPQAIGPYGGDGVNSNSGVKAPPPKLYDACAGGSLQPTTKSQEVKTDTQAGTSVDRPPSQGGESSRGRTTGLSDSHLEAPYTAYQEVLSWEIDNHQVLFPSKSAGAAPVVQQTAAPTCVVVQAGYAVREGPLGKPPKPGAPLYPAGSPTATIKNAFVSPPSFVPLAAKDQYQMNVQWRYVFLMKVKLPNMEALAVQYPGDPRVTVADADRPKPELSNLLVVPGS